MPGGAGPIKLEQAADAKSAISALAGNRPHWDMERPPLFAEAEARCAGGGHGQRWRALNTRLHPRQRVERRHKGPTIVLSAFDSRASGASAAAMPGLDRPNAFKQLQGWGGLPASLREPEKTCSYMSDATRMLPYDTAGAATVPSKRFRHRGYCCCDQSWHCLAWCVSS